LLDSYLALGNKSLKERADGTETIAGLKALDEFCNGMNAVQLTTDAAARFVRERKAESPCVGNACINRSLAALRRMLTIAKRSRKIHDIPFIQFLKEPPARKGFLPIEKFDELVALLPTHLRPLVTLLYYCGTRIGEALQIEWNQVDLDARLIRLEEEQTKGDEARTLPLPPALVMMLTDVEPKTGSAPHGSARVFEGTNLRKEWVRACAACGLGTLTEVEGRPYDPLYSGLTLHDLRRSAVRNLVNAGVPERVAMSISGHKTRSVFDRYHIVSTVDVTDAMRKVVASSLKGKASLAKPVHSVGKKRLKALK
jgi:integrase